MKPVFLSLAFIAALALPASHALAGCGGGNIDAPDILASHVVYDLGSGDFGFIEGAFDPRLSTALPQADLANMWQSFDQSLGAIQSQGEPTMTPQGAQMVVQVPVKFASGQGTVQILVNNDDVTIDGLSLLPAS